MRVNHIFLRHFMTEDIQEPGLPTTESSHTYEFYKQYLEYNCPVTPGWTQDIPFEVNVTPTVSYNEVQIRPVMKKDHLNVVWVPMHYPTWRWFNNFYPEAFHDLEILADPNSEYPTAVVFDYNNETLLPGNFTNNEGQIDILSDKDYSQFYCSTLAWNRHNVVDEIGFRDIVSCYHGLGGLVFFNALKEDLLLKSREIFTKAGEEYPIRYYCPNNVFRPNRAMGIVKMYNKGMLDDTEWNMNKFSQWYEMDQFISNTPFRSHVEEYFKLFGISPRTNSYPWNKEFNMDRINQDKGDHSMSNRSKYDTFSRSLIEKCYIYIVQNLVTEAPSEKPINPLKPVHVGDWDEKILKGFMYGMPTFVNGRQGTCKIMEKLGFDMLTDYNIHDYDSEPDDIVRIDKMLDCAINFPKPNNDIVQRIQNNKDLVTSKEFWWKGQSELIKKLLDNHTV